MKLSDIGSTKDEGAIVAIKQFLANDTSGECYPASELGEKLSMGRTTISRLAWKIPVANKIKLKHNRHIQWFYGSEKVIAALRKRVEGK